MEVDGIAEITAEHHRDWYGDLIRRASLLSLQADRWFQECGPSAYLQCCTFWPWIFSARLPAVSRSCAVFVLWFMHGMQLQPLALRRFRLSSMLPSWKADWIHSSRLLEIKSSLTGCSVWEENCTGPGIQHLCMGQVYHTRAWAPHSQMGSGPQRNCWWEAWLGACSRHPGRFLRIAFRSSQSECPREHYQYSVLIWVDPSD